MRWAARVAWTALFLASGCTTYDAAIKCDTADQCAEFNSKLQSPKCLQYWCVDHRCVVGPRDLDGDGRGTASTICQSVVAPYLIGELRADDCCDSGKELACCLGEQTCGPVGADEWTFSTLDCRESQVTCDFPPETSDRPARMNPGLREELDGIDNDCSGTVDDTFDCSEVDPPRRCATDPKTGLAFQVTGSCQPGTEFCINGKRTPCLGAIAPTAERCDYVDNDCDGQVDEGVSCDGDCCGPNETCASGPPPSVDGGFTYRFCVSDDANRCLSGTAQQYYCSAERPLCCSSVSGAVKTCCDGDEQCWRTQNTAICIPRNATGCSNGSYCPVGSKCVPGGCIPNEASSCGAGWCDAHFLCCGQSCCGGGTECAYRNGVAVRCIPWAGELCANNGYCGQHFRCCGTAANSWCCRDNQSCTATGCL